MNVCIVGENSGKSSKSTAQFTAGPGALTQKSEAAMSEIERAKLVSQLFELINAEISLERVINGGYVVMMCRRRWSEVRGWESWRSGRRP